MTWTGDPVFLEQVIRDAGVSVSLYPGALDRGQGDFYQIWGIIDHHTGAPVGSNPGPGAIANHPTLGLASQIHLSRKGVATICGVGIAYHAGEGSWPGIRTNAANQVTIGVEAENSGTEGWSSEQYWAYVRINAAILRKIEQPSSHTIGHKEWAKVQGKWDPGGMDMGKFRADVGNMIAELNGVKPDVPVIENQIDRVRFFSDWLGKRLHDGEKPCKDSVGRYADFENGSIYWHPDTGAVPIPKLVYEVWAARGWEIEFLGYPQRFHVVYEGEGDLQSFQGGTIARRYGTPGFVCHGVIGRRWIEEGGVRDVDGKPTKLGWPTSDEYDFAGGRRQDFEHGSLLWHPSGAIEITGDNR